MITNKDSDFSVKIKIYERKELLSDSTFSVPQAVIEICVLSHVVIIRKNSIEECTQMCLEENILGALNKSCDAFQFNELMSYFEYNDYEYLLFDKRLKAITN